MPYTSYPVRIPPGFPVDSLLGPSEPLPPRSFLDVTFWRVPVAAAGVMEYRHNSPVMIVPYPSPPRLDPRNRPHEILKRDHEARSARGWQQ